MLPSAIVILASFLLTVASASARPVVAPAGISTSTAAAAAITCNVKAFKPVIHPVFSPYGVGFDDQIICTGVVAHIHIWLAPWFCAGNCPANRYVLHSTYDDPVNQKQAAWGDVVTPCQPGGWYYTRAGGWAEDASGHRYPITNVGVFSPGVHTNTPTC